MSFSLKENTCASGDNVKTDDHIKKAENKKINLLAIVNPATFISPVSSSGS